MKLRFIILGLLLALPAVSALAAPTGSPCKDGGAFKIHKSASAVLRMAHIDTIVVCEAEPQKLYLAKEVRRPYPNSEFISGYELVDSVAAGSYSAYFTRPGEVANRYEYDPSSDNVSA